MLIFIFKLLFLVEVFKLFSNLLLLVILVVFEKVKVFRFLFGIEVIVFELEG